MPLDKTGLELDQVSIASASPLPAEAVIEQDLGDQDLREGVLAKSGKCQTQRLSMREVQRQSFSRFRHRFGTYSQWWVMLSCLYTCVYCCLSVYSFQESIEPSTAELLGTTIKPCPPWSAAKWPVPLWKRTNRYVSRSKSEAWCRSRNCPNGHDSCCRLFVCSQVRLFGAQYSS